LVDDPRAAEAVQTTTTRSYTEISIFVNIYKIEIKVTYIYRHVYKETGIESVSPDHHAEGIASLVNWCSSLKASTENPVHVL
jgi:hypothetical protein